MYIVHGLSPTPELNMKSDSESIMMSEKDMEDLDKTEKFDDDLISTETLQDIRDGNRTHPEINKRKARMAIRNRIKQKKSQCKGALRGMHKMEKGLHRFSVLLYRRFRRN